jgi:ComF family protein
MEKMWQRFKLSKSAVDMVLPPICPVTGHIVDKVGQIHESFWQVLNFITPPYCKKCGLPHLSLKQDDTSSQKQHLCASCLEHPPHFDTHRSVLIYDDASKMLVLKFKHQDHGHLVKTFTPWLSRILSEFQDIDIIIPVPLHYKRLLYRRYNQAALIAKDLAVHDGIIYRGDILKRIRATASQGHKSPKERATNVKGAFKVKEKHRPLIEGKNILLVDDVYTTGATLNACSLSLKKSGAAKVHCLSVARAIKD